MQWCKTANDLKKAAVQSRRRESELCKGTHRPLVAEQWPAALTCPSCTTTQVGGLWVVTQQTLTSACTSGVEKRSTVQLLWEPPICLPPVLSSGAHVRHLRQNQTNEWSDTVTNYQTADWWHQSPESEKKNSLKMCFCLCLAALVKNIWSVCVSFKSLLHRRGQKVTISVWVTAVMVSGAIFKSRGEEQSWLMCGPCASSFRTKKISTALLVKQL